MSRGSDVLLFCTTDSVVPITRAFFDAHMCNGVVPRLLGFEMQDGLTTKYASTTPCGAYTIFRTLGISTIALNNLMRWMRVGHVTDAYRDVAYDASLRLGGFAAIDAAMTKHRANEHAKRRK